MKRILSRMGFSSQNVIVLAGIILALVVIILGTAMEGRNQKASAATKYGIQESVSDSIMHTHDSSMVEGKSPLTTGSTMFEQNK